MSESHFECILWDFGGIFTGSPFYSIDIYSAHLGVKSQELIELVLGYGLDLTELERVGVPAIEDAARNYEILIILFMMILCLKL